MTDWTPLARGGAEEAGERAAREARHQVLIELLGAYADRELPPETTSQIEAHLVGCARCRNELAVHQAVRLRLGVTPPVAAPPALRERVASAIAATPVPVEVSSAAAPRATIWTRRRLVVVVAVALLTLVVAIATSIMPRKEKLASPNVSRLSVSPSTVSLLNDALSDYRRVTAGDLPGRARDLDLVRGAVAFPIDPLRVPEVRLLAAWTTDLGGEPAAVLAYRWNDRIILQYLVPEGRFFRHPAIRAAVTGNHLLVASANPQGLVAWPTREAGAILIGDVDSRRLAELTAADLLAKAARRGAE